MKLKLYSSRRGERIPNLVSVQNSALEILPTVLVCPLKSREAVTNVRTTLRWENETFTVLCDLTRPIHRDALTQVGEADELTSKIIVETVLKLLALEE